MTDDRGTARSNALPSPEDALGFLLNQLGLIVRERTARALEPLAITPRSLGMLLVLAEQPGISQTELSRRLRTDRTTVSQMVDELTRAGLIERGVAVADRRNHRLVLTPDGLTSAQDASERVTQVEQNLGSSSTSESLDELKRGLARLLADIQRSGTPFDAPRTFARGMGNHS